MHLYSNSLLLLICVLLFSLPAEVVAEDKPSNPVSKNPTPQEYVKRNPRSTFVPAGQLVIDGTYMRCGNMPTILDPNLSDFSAAYPGFLILNPRHMRGKSKVLKLYFYSVACGFQFRGPDATLADCLAVQRGRQLGWLDERGLSEICEFMRPAKGDPKEKALPGPARCENMRRCFASTPR